jgi:hypothetical protein
LESKRDHVDQDIDAVAQNLIQRSKLESVNGDEWSVRDRRVRWGACGKRHLPAALDQASGGRAADLARAAENQCRLHGWMLSRSIS